MPQERLGRPGDHPPLHQLHHAVCQHLGVQAKVFVIPQSCRQQQAEVASSWQQSAAAAATWAEGSGGQMRGGAGGSLPGKTGLFLLVLLVGAHNHTHTHRYTATQPYTHARRAQPSHRVPPRLGSCRCPSAALRRLAPALPRAAQWPETPRPGAPPAGRAPAAGCEAWGWGRRAGPRGRWE